jgi:S1-C subfamily serine protease
VRAVEDNSPAAAAGIQAGDLLAAANGVVLDGVDVLYGLLDAVAGGGSLELTVVRGTEERTVTASFEATGAAA